MTAAWFAFQFLAEALIRMGKPPVADRPSRMTSSIAGPLSRHIESNPYVR
jgi:hypothetical protein